MSKQESRHAGKNTVVVKLCHSHRMGISIFYTVFTATLLAAVFFLDRYTKAGLYTVLLLLAPIALFLPLPLYFATWQISFDRSGIRKYLFGRCTHSYPWTEIQEVRSSISGTELVYIRILFRDKKAVRFRIDCDNAEKARKLILSHCSIVGKQ